MLIGVVTALLPAFVFTDLWGMFIVPLGLPPMPNIALTMGVMLVVIFPFMNLFTMFGLLLAGSALSEEKLEDFTFRLRILGFVMPVWGWLLAHFYM